MIGPSLLAGRCLLRSLSRAGLIAALILTPSVSCHSADGVSAVPTASATPELSAADAQSDFDFMLQALEEAHPGLYRYTAKADLDREFSAQRAKLNRPMTNVEFFTAMSETLGLIKCGHTSIRPDDAMGKAFGNAPLFPLQVIVEGRRLVVQSNETPDDRTILPGMEIIEINGHKVADLLKRFWRVDSADGDIETSKRVHIQKAFGMYYWFLIEQTAEFVVKARDDMGRTSEAKLAGVMRGNLGKSDNPVNAAVRASSAKAKWPGGTLSWRFLKDPEIAQIRIRLFKGDDFPQWMDDTFKTLREKGTKTLIVDLRGNGGGDDMSGAMLVSYLTDRPFRIFDHIDIKTIEPSFKAQTDWSAERTAELRDKVSANPEGGYFLSHSGANEQAPAMTPFLGKVFVLIDGGTFSTAADVCAVLHHLKRATFIGEETGGAYYGNNSGILASVTLPNSRFQLRLPIFEYWNAVSGYAGKRRGTVPDHLVETKAESLLRGIDEQLELALKLAKPVSGEEPK